MEIARTTTTTTPAWLGNNTGCVTAAVVAPRRSADGSTSFGEGPHYSGTGKLPRELKSREQKEENNPL